MVNNGLSSSDFGLDSLCSLIFEWISRTFDSLILEGDITSIKGDNVIPDLIKY